MTGTVSALKFSFALMLLLIASSRFFAPVTFAGVGEVETASALADAEGALVSAYQAVLKAEEAGANVSGLLARLNEAGGFLAQARMAYRLGYFDEAASFADSSRNIGGEVQDAALELKDAAVSEGWQSTMLTMVASVVGVAVIAIGSLWTWHFLKRRYGGGGFPRSESAS